MLRIQITIQGITPYMPHRFTDEAGEACSNGNRAISSLGKQTPFERAKSFLYTHSGKPDGKPVIIQPAIFGAIVEAGKFFKLGKSKMTTQKTSLVPAYLSVNGTAFLITHKDPWTVDTRAVRIPATGGRILEHRPMFHDWKVGFEMEVYAGIDEKLARDLVDTAGLRIGLGDMRPEKKNCYGKFKVVEWKCEKLDDIGGAVLEVDE